jgi:hypothetical protein
VPGKSLSVVEFLRSGQEEIKTKAEAGEEKLEQRNEI